MKKSWLLLLLGYLIPSVSAQINFYQGSSQLIQWIQDLFYPVFSALFSGGFDYLFERILFFFIIIVLVFIALRNVPVIGGNKVALWVLVFSISTLAVRFTQDLDFVRFVLFPYSILGVALLSGLPFVIFFFFVNSFDESAVRKVLWSFYIIIYLGLWYFNLQELGDIAYIYLFAGILAFIMLIADRVVRGAYVRAAIKKGLKPHMVEQMIDLRKKIEENTKRLNDASGSEKEVLSKKIADDYDTMKKISKGMV
jgi:hypothetical protein